MKNIQNYIVFIMGLALFTTSISLAYPEIKNKDLDLKDNSFISLESTPITKTEDSNVKNTINVVITAYSSCPLETDDSPFLTANGSTVEDGIVANNLLPFGTEIRIPELYGNKVFVVQDRMSSRKGNYHVDIWFPTKEQALQFGSVRTYIEILKS